MNGYGYWPHLPVLELDRKEKIYIVGTRRVQNWSSKKQKVVKTSFMENTEYKCQSRTIPKFILCTSLSHSYYAAFWDNPKKLLSVLAHNFLLNVFQNSLTWYSYRPRNTRNTTSLFTVDTHGHSILSFIVWIKESRNVQLFWLSALNV